MSLELAALRMGGIAYCDYCSRKFRLRRDATVINSAASGNRLHFAVFCKQCIRKGNTEVPVLRLDPDFVVPTPSNRMYWFSNFGEVGNTSYVVSFVDGDIVTDVPGDSDAD